MADEVVLNKAAVIERCLERVIEDYENHEAELETNYTRQDAIVLTPPSGFGGRYRPRHARDARG